ncbi:hypothetical protein QYE76_034605 [Lolium multiflorum]|uniref:Uncharacterized protein n=1 Tax=Lolium multiflorum TaxID=4521 RepID=A0AAD8QZG2_LOLMU|nr:hypothetical protein QYE76_034605 [Lolium multiflorum]
MMAAASGTLVVWRAVFPALGVLMVGTLLYTCFTDGSPFHTELLTRNVPEVLLSFSVDDIGVEISLQLSMFTF